MVFSICALLFADVIASILAMLAGRGEKKTDNVFLDSNKSSNESFILA